MENVFDTAKNNSPKLRPDESTRFGNLAKLRRSADLDYEGSEFELQCIAAAENDAALDSATDEEIAAVEEYAELRLKPDTNITMPGKQSLKRSEKFRSILRTTTISVPAAAAVLFAVFLTQNSNDTPPQDANIAQNRSENQQPERKVENNDARKIDDDARIRPRRTTDTLKRRIKPAKTKPVRKKTSNVETPESEPETATNREYCAFAKISPKVVEIDKPTIRNINIDKILKSATGGQLNLLAEDFDSDRNSDPYPVGSPIRNFLTSRFKQTVHDKSAEKSIAEWIVKNEQSGTLEIYPNNEANTTILQEYDENGKLVATRIFTSKELSYNVQYAAK